MYSSYHYYVFRRGRDGYTVCGMDIQKTNDQPGHGIGVEQKLEGAVSVKTGLVRQRFREVALIISLGKRCKHDVNGRLKESRTRLRTTKRAYRQELTAI
jgi:hypothetical protein